MPRPRSWAVWVTLATGLAALGAPPDRPPASPTPPEGPDGGTSAWPAGGKTRYLLLRGKLQRLGQSDPDGNFIPDAEVVSVSGTLFSLRDAVTVNGYTTDNRCVFEHRSGRLIRGTLVANPRGVFVPEIGSTILDLKKDYDLKTADRIVYNQRETLRPSPPAPEPAKAGSPPGWRLVPFREAYANTPAADLWFARVIGEVMELGHLSDDGEFVPDYGLPVFPFVRVKAPVDHAHSQRHMYYTLPIDGAHGPKRGKDTEEVFEYRSGRLIQGTLQKTGNFVPELGSKVIDFKDYNVLGWRRVYNLPGVMRPSK